MKFSFQTTRSGCMTYRVDCGERVCVCTCVCERERERESVCVCVAEPDSTKCDMLLTLEKHCY